MKDLTLVSIVDFAVENELESYEFYRDASEKVENTELKDIFKKLAEEELEHKRFLEDFLASGVEDIKIENTEDYNISETLDSPKLSVDMSFADAIALAIKKEEEAMIMYRNLAMTCETSREKELFLGLENMERLHKTKLEDIYTNVAFGEVW